MSILVINQSRLYNLNDVVDWYFQDEIQGAIASCIDCYWHKSKRIFCIDDTSTFVGYSRQ